MPSLAAGTSPQASVSTRAGPILQGEYANTNDYVAMLLTQQAEIVGKGLLFGLVPVQADGSVVGAELFWMRASVLGRAGVHEAHDIGLTAAIAEESRNYPGESPARNWRTSPWRCWPQTCRLAWRPR